VGELSAEEARYLLHKLLAMTVNQTCLATQKEGRIRHAGQIGKKFLLTVTTSEIYQRFNQPVDLIRRQRKKDRR
jgi:hypothetical protein